MDRRSVTFVIAALTVPRAATAQAEGRLEAGLSRVDYQGFLPSAAWSLSPELRFWKPRIALAGRATLLQFESGNTSIYGVIKGSSTLFNSALFAVNLETELAASRYETFGRSSHMLGRLAMRFGGLSSRTRFTIAAIGGARTTDGQGLGGVEGRVELDRRGAGLYLSGSITQVGEAGYSDFGATVRIGPAEGIRGFSSLGARAGDRRNGDNVVFQGTVVLPLTSSLGVWLGAGRFASDPLRGTAAGNHASLGITLSKSIRRHTAVARLSSDSIAEPYLPVTLENVRRGKQAAYTLVFRVRGNASSVEIMGDFTDWVPRPLQPAGKNLWIVNVEAAPGMHSLNVRLDKEAWGVPMGTSARPDDFQSWVGSVVLQ